MAQTLSDDFDDGVFNTVAWMTNTAISTQAFNVRPDLVTIDESTGQLVFSESGAQTYYGMNAYVTNSFYDLRGKRISAKLSVVGGLDAWIAIGTDRFNMVQAYISAGGTLMLTRSYRNNSNPLDYAYTQADAYIALRVSANGNTIFCESSPDGVNWTVRGSIKGHLPYISASQVEIGGGGWRPAAGFFTATVDDFKIE